MKTYSNEILKEHTICSFPHGSTVYCIKPTQYSDIDVVTIVDNTLDFSEYENKIYEVKSKTWCCEREMEVDTQYINEATFIEMVKNHHIIALESLWLPDYCYTGKYDYNKYFELDKWKLRKTISSIVSNAWAKCHKKLTVEKDYDYYRGLKSLFHCLRLLCFGIQIAKYGEIVLYSEANHYWSDLWEKDVVPSHKWEDYKAKYQPELNRLKSEFVALCPKPEDYKKD